MTQKFDAHRLNARDVRTQFETKFAVGSYLAYQGDRFVERFDANSYLTLTTAIDLFDLGGTRQELAENLARSTCRWLVMSFSSDWLFPFEAEYAEDISGYRQLVSTVTVISLLHPDEHAQHEEFGLICRARRGTQEIEVPLADVELKESTPNYRPIEDYWYWFWNWRFDPQI